MGSFSPSVFACGEATSLTEGGKGATCNFAFCTLHFVFLFRYGDGQHDLAFGFPAFRHCGDARELYPGEGLVEIA